MYLKKIANAYRRFADFIKTPLIPQFLSIAQQPNPSHVREPLVMSMLALRLNQRAALAAVLLLAAVIAFVCVRRTGSEPPLEEPVKQKSSPTASRSGAAGLH